MNKVRNQFWLLLVVFCFAALNPGCKDKETTGGTDARSEKLKYFDKQQPSVMPNGKIKMDTVKETSDDKIEYQTDDGKTWRVKMTKGADGEYRYDTPDEVK